MNRPRLTLLLVAFLVAAGGLLQGFRAISRQREQVNAQHQHLAQMEKLLAAQRDEHDAILRDLAQAERQLAELAPAAAPMASAAEQARDAEIKTWLARVKRLKQLFEQQPGQRIPELRLLKDEDWLRVAKQSDLENEDGLRKALAAVRGTAKSLFGMQLSAALQKLEKATGSEQPASITALAPYFDPPVDGDMLARYEFAPATYRPARNGQPAWGVQDSAPVYPDYDSRTHVSANGSTGSAGAPFAWIPNFSEKFQQAAKAYSAANRGIEPTGPADVIPYVNPPFDDATTERILRAYREQKP